jgi:hypothetical protein
MKTFTECSLFTFILLCSACQPEDWIDVGVKSLSSDTIMSYIVHQVTIDQYESLDSERHTEFMTDALLCHMHESSRQNLFFISQQDDSFVEYEYDEVPVVSETQMNWVVFKDGNSELVVENLIPKDINPLLILAENYRSEEVTIARLIISSGKMKVYNKKNKLLVEDDCPAISMTKFVDAFVAYTHEDAEISQKLLVRTERPTEINSTIQNDTTIKIEKAVKSDFFLSRFPVLASINKAVAVMNDDLTKILRFELYANHQLIHRKVFFYQEDSLLFNYNKFRKVSENPRLIDAATLFLSSDGKPYIYRIRTLYHRNQLILMQD